MAILQPSNPEKLSKKKKTSLVDEMVRRFSKVMPEPKCELYYETHYQLLVSVVLSAQTTDKMVNRCMEPLYKKGFDIEQVLSLKPEGLLKHIRSIGLAPTKSKNVFKLSQILKERFDSKVPNVREDLESLPGVGRKTANVILGELFGQPTLAVDTHVYRVGLRLGLHQANSALKAESELMQVVDLGYLPRAHHWFILHGRYTCKAQKPNCDDCLLNDLCPSLK